MLKPWSYQEEYKKLRKKILYSLDKVFKSNNLFFGNELIKFEKAFLKKNKSKYGVAVKNGTEALIIALKCLNIGFGDEVITVSNTAIPTVSAIRSVGAIPKFVDINDNYLINVSLIEKKISKKTKAIIAVHLYGQSCDMTNINKIAKKNNLKVIEDCAQAQGAMHKNINVGNFGDIGCFSFYPTKILGAYGDGGFLTTKNNNLFKKLRRIRFYGIEELNPKNKYNNKYYAFEDGINSRLDEVQAAILNIKINYLNNYIKRRQTIAKIYDNKLKNTNLVLPKIFYKNNHTYHLYVVRHKERNKILKKLIKKGLELKINYPYPIHKMKAYNNNSKNNYDLSKTEKFSKEIFSLPIYPEIKKKDLLYIIKLIKSTLNSVN